MDPAEVLREAISYSSKIRAVDRTLHCGNGLEDQGVTEPLLLLLLVFLSRTGC